jgi:hypothetical protein
VITRDPVIEVNPSRLGADRGVTDRGEGDNQHGEEPSVSSHLWLNYTPSADYPAGALDCIEAPNDHEFLKQIRDRATAFSLGEAETKSITLKLVAQP